MNILDDMGVNYQDIFILEVNYYFKTVRDRQAYPTVTNI